MVIDAGANACPIGALPDCGPDLSGMVADLLRNVRLL